MSILVFFAGVGGGFFASLVWDQYKLYKKNKPTAPVKTGFDSEGRYYEE